MFGKFLRLLSGAAVLGGAVTLIAMTVHITADVLLKYFMNRPLSGTLEIVSAYYMVAVVFLPLASVELARDSIAVDVGYQFMPNLMKLACMVIVFSVTTVVYAVLAYSSWGDALKSFGMREVVMGNALVSIWPGRFVLPVSFGLAALASLYNLYLFATDAEERRAIVSTGDVETEV